MKKILLTLFFIGSLSANELWSQQTVGLFENSPESYNGYTLFTSGTMTYLIDNCGQLVNQWESLYSAGLSVYLLENGNLLRTARIGGLYNGGGAGGRIEIYSWDNELLWGYDYSTADYRQHHDIAPMPNGNILLIAWEGRTTVEAIQQGRNPDLLSDLGLWSEQIVEIEPIGTDSANIVWEWHLWDHLIQDFNEFQDNYGDVAAHPELVDINFAPNFGNGPLASADWIHLNSVDYNPELDQIVVSSRFFNEFWVIDHSTTTDEAAGHTGGNAGIGGDLLYRWGNPISYRRGTVEDRQLYGQHDVQWIKPGMPGAGHFLVYNNGDGRPSPAFSSVDELISPIQADGTYQVEPETAYGPDQLSWSYAATPPPSFYSPRISGTQRLPNGNTLICEGGRGRFFEVTAEGEVVWDYYCPTGSNGPVEQGTENVMGNIFKIRRYAENFPGFEGKDLIPGEPIEINPLPSDCMIISGSEDAINITSTSRSTLELFSNPIINGKIQLVNNDGARWRIEVFNINGQCLNQSIQSDQMINISCANWPKGIYILKAVHHGRNSSKKAVSTSLRIIIN